MATYLVYLSVEEPLTQFHIQCQCFWQGKSCDLDVATILERWIVYVDDERGEVKLTTHDS